MAYKSLIDYYGGGMVKPSKGYQLGGLVAGARRQRDYSGEMRSLQEAAERAAESRRKVGGNLLRKLAVGTAGTLLGGPAGAAAALAGDQALRERAYKKADFSGGKYAQDIRGELGKQESAFKKQGLARVGIAGVEGYLGGKSSGMFGKAASGVKGGVGQLRDIAGFLKEGGTMGDVLGGYAQKIGESGVFGKGSAISNRLLKSGASAGIAPTVPDAMKKTLSKEARQEAFTKGVEPMFEQNEWLWKTPGSTDSEWAVPDDAYAKSVLTPTDTYADLAEGFEPDMADFEKIEFGPTERQLWGSQTDAELAQEAARWQPWEQPSAPQPSLAGAQPSFSQELLSGVYSAPPESVSPAPSMAGSLMPDMPPAGFSGQDMMVGEAGVSEFEPFRIPSLLGESFEGYNPFDTSYEEFRSDWMPAGIQTAGGIGYKGGGLIEGLMPKGYQEGGQVGYGTATNPQDALRQMGMGEVADDPRLEKYLEDLPQFGMGYKQQLGDITAGARTGLLNIGKEGRLTGARTGFAGGGGWMNPEARQQVQRQFGTQRRGLVEGYQADLLSAIADIEGKGGFEFGVTAAGGAGTVAGGTHDAPISDENWSPPINPTEGATYNYMGDNYIFSNGGWMSESSMQGEGE